MLEVLHRAPAAMESGNQSATDLFLLQTRPPRNTEGPVLPIQIRLREQEQSMETMDAVAEQARSAWHDLQRNGMAGKIAVPGEAAYERAREIWNGAVTARPALFALCETKQ